MVLLSSCAFDIVLSTADGKQCDALVDVVSELEGSCGEGDEDKDGGENEDGAGEESGGGGVWAVIFETKTRGAGIWSGEDDGERDLVLTIFAIDTGTGSVAEEFEGES